MQALEERDYFTDYEILKDPYSFFEAVRAHGPVYQPPGKEYLIVTGFQETLEVLKNTTDFSAIIGLQGASAPLPFVPEGADITAQVEAHRDQFLGGDLLVNYDDELHTKIRSLLNRLFTPSRLKANEEFIQQYSDEIARKMAAKGGCEMIKEVATPFVTLVIADLLGVPADDRQMFMDVIEAAPQPGSLDSGENDFSSPNHPLVVMGGYFANYIADRRENPRDDILTEFAQSTFPDGSEPDMVELVKMATFLFGAGQDTSAKLLGNSIRYITDQPGLQDKLRADPSLIPQLIEEVLRLEGSTKQTARLARRDTRIGSLEIPAGTRVMLALAAANRDPERWENPNELVLDRPKIKEHVAFGRGKHVCAGAPLARVEVRVILEKLLACTSNIDLDEEKHGPRGKRDLDFEASFIIRGLSELYVKLTPAEDMDWTTVESTLVSQPAASQAPSEATESGIFSTAKTKIGELLGNPTTLAVLDKHFPGMSQDKRIAMAKGMTLRSVQKFAPGQFSNDALDAVDRDLARI